MRLWTSTLQSNRTPWPAAPGLLVALNLWVPRLKNDVSCILSEADVIQLCKVTTEVLREEPNVVPVNAPLTVVGDIHGQWYDLLEIFKIGCGHTQVPR